MLGQHAVDDRLYSRPVGVGDQAVVQRDDAFLGSTSEPSIGSASSRTRR